MKRIAGIFLLALALCAPTAIATAQQNKAEQMYQQALYEMEGKGNYEKALGIFGQIMKDFSDNRRISAKAQFQTGVCYEKLGKSGAQNAYERIIKQYPDQADLVAQARARLAALSASTESGRGPVARRLLTYLDTDINDFNDMVPSPEGHRVAYTRLGTDGTLLVRDLATGATEQLAPSLPATRNQYPIWSPDGKQIAYGSQDSQTRTGSVRIIDVTSHKEISSFRAERSAPVDWSRDGRFLLLRCSAADRTAEASLLLLEISNGSTTVLADTIPLLSAASFSPDGRFVAYSARDGGRIHIFAKPVSGGARRQITDLNGGESPRWSPDGRAIAFTRSDGVYVIPVTNGAASGAPQRVHESRAAYLQAWTEMGGLYMTIFGGQSISYQMPVDPGTGRTGAGKAQPLPEQLQDVARFAWSPDMRQIAFATVFEGISIYSVGRQTATRYEVGHRGIVWDLWWSADGHEVMWEPDARTRPGTVLALDPSTGKVREPFVRVMEAGVISLSSDGRRIVYKRMAADSSGNELVVAELGKPEKRVVAAPRDSSAGRLSNWVRARFSPRADRVLFGRQTSVAGTLWVVSSDGTDARILGTVSMIWSAVWDPSSRFIAYSGKVNGRVVLRVVEVATGIEHDVPLPAQDADGVQVGDWSPDGRFIGFRADEARWEYWTLQGLQEGVR
ncbi:MAG: tetratricopeptide repeat protein [Ignavibacteria bacterium]|nr:tetratricopeptide repeat protein [Ignavibacteria bacterium]